MRSDTFRVHTGSREAVHDISRQCAEFVASYDEGLLHVFVPHATAGIAILETGAGRTTTCSRLWVTCSPPTTAGGTGTARPGTGGRT
jgi:thiamine phosphate synthase YjbQ (UPF0047 family)